MVEDGYDLLARDAFEVVQELVDGRAVFESFEKRGDGEASVLEDPRSADFVRASFDGVATVPVAHGAAFSLHGFDVLGEFSIDTAGMALDDVSRTVRENKDPCDPPRRVREVLHLFRQ